MTTTAAESIVMGMSFWTATTIFVLAYAAIVMDVAHKTVVALASNIGGAATLIGDPPNIMIASKAH